MEMIGTLHNDHIHLW